MAIELETAELTIDTVGVEAAQQALDALGVKTDLINQAGADEDKGKPNTPEAATADEKAESGASADVAEFRANRPAVPVQGPSEPAPEYEEYDLADFADGSRYPRTPTDGWPIADERPPSEAEPADVEERSAIDLTPLLDAMNQQNLVLERIATLLENRPPATHPTY